MRGKAAVQPSPVNLEACRAVLALALVLCQTAPSRSQCFFALDGRRLERLGGAAGFQGQPRVCRNGAGTKLFLTARMEDNTTLAEIVSQHGAAFKRFPSGRPVLGENGELVAWVDQFSGGGVHHSRGESAGVCHRRGDSDCLHKRLSGKVRVLPGCGILPFGHAPSPKRHAGRVDVLRPSRSHFSPRAPRT